MCEMQAAINLGKKIFKQEITLVIWGLILINIVNLYYNLFLPGAFATLSLLFSFHVFYTLRKAEENNFSFKKYYSLTMDQFPEIGFYFESLNLTLFFIKNGRSLAVGIFFLLAKNTIIESIEPVIKDTISIDKIYSFVFTVLVLGIFVLFIGHILIRTIVYLDKREARVALNILLNQAQEIGIDIKGRHHYGQYRVNFDILLDDLYSGEFSREKSAEIYSNLLRYKKYLSDIEVNNFMSNPQSSNRGNLKI